MNARLDQGGGVMLEVGGVEKPLAVVAIVRRIREYLRAMIYARKPVNAVTVTRQQYSDLLRAATKKRDDAAPPRCGVAGRWRAAAHGGR